MYPTARAAGAAFDPTTRRWRSLPAPPNLVAQLIWTDHELLAFDSGTGELARLNPTSTEWKTASRAPISARAVSGTAVWAHTRFVVWGGEQFDYGPGSVPPRAASDGAAWDPTTDTWTPMPTLPTNAPANAGGVFAGDRLIAWGGTTDPGQPPALVAASWTPPT